MRANKPATKPVLTRLLYRARNLRSRELFRALDEHVSGQVLDVGGWDFVDVAVARGARFDLWVTLERDPARLPEPGRPSTAVVCGDGCRLGIASDRFDAVVNVQVLEHVFEPILMVQEISRVLKPGGRAVFLIPQTSTTHLAPHFYGNFTTYWIEEAMRRAGLEVIEARTLGGVWSSMASHLIHYFLQVARTPGMSDPAIKRRPAFYVLLPLQAIYALVSIPITMLLSLGDLAEEPNNHLVVARKPTMGGA